MGFLAARGAQWLDKLLVFHPRCTTAPGINTRNADVSQTGVNNNNTGVTKGGERRTNSAFCGLLAL
jgi:hypothetical protein